MSFYTFLEVLAGILRLQGSSSICPISDEHHADMSFDATDPYKIPNLGDTANILEALMLRHVMRRMWIVNSDDG